jgi:uncharacterized protein DUF5753
MRRQEMLTAKNAPKYEVVLDARALLLGVGGTELIKDQIQSLADRGESLRRLDLRIIPFGAVVPVFSTVGFTVYDFRTPDSPEVAWVESPTGDVYFSAPEDIQRYASLFKALQGVALPPDRSVGYLRSLVIDLERYLTEPNREGDGG